MSKETELSDEQIDNCVGNLGMSENSILVGPEEIRKAMRAVIAADRELRRGDAAMPIRDIRHGTVNLVLLEDAQAALAAKDAEIAELRLALDASGIEDMRNEIVFQLNQRNVQAERIAALTAERDALRKDAEQWSPDDLREFCAIGRAVNRAAMELPDGLRVRIDLERDAGTAEWLDVAHGKWLSIGSGDLFSAQIDAAIDAAIAKDEAK